MLETEWTLETLNKGYQQGYMTGLAGKGRSECQFENDVLIAAWEAGWDDGAAQYTRSLEDRTRTSIRSA
ncbi:ribosome modulation factor [Reinekea sp.]|uniref:ribosome modulation factor n=1 Tax=Reinekea sp. TaxID=1970455 RepID=UPI003989141C